MNIRKTVFVITLITLVSFACFAASFTTWCGYCVSEMPDIEKLYKDLPEGSNIIAICADAYESPDDLKDIVEYFGLDFTIIKMDIEDLLEIYGVLGYPTTVFVDKTGKIIASVSGAKTYAMYRNAITTLLNRK